MKLVFKITVMDALIFAVTFCISVSLVAFLLRLLQLAPEEMTEPMFRSGAVIALLLMIAYSVNSIWHQEKL